MVNPSQQGRGADRNSWALQTATDAEVVSGLTEGEPVVVSDRSGLKAGEEVRPQVVQRMQGRRYQAKR